MSVGTARPLSTLAGVLALVVCGACAPSPSVQLARSVDKAASWAAAAVFAGDAVDGGRAPRAYATDLYRHGTDDVGQIASAIRKLDATGHDRDAAIDACGELADALRDAAAGRADRGRFASVARHLRQLAADVRARPEGPGREP